MTIRRSDIEYMVSECVRCLVREGTGSESLSEVLDKVDRMPSEKIVPYMLKRFHYLGSGIGRAVFQFDDTTVIKVCTGKTDQNREEWEAFQQMGRSPLLARVYWHAWDYRWIVSEYVMEATPVDFVTLLGVKFKPEGYMSAHPERQLDKLDAVRKGGGIYAPSAEYDYQRALKNINDRELYYQYYGRDYVDTKDEDAYDSELSVRDFIDWCYEGMPKKWKRPGTYGDLAEGYSSLIEYSPWFRELSEMIRAGMSDLHIDNFGIARRNGKECIVILDSGIIEQ